MDIKKIQNKIESLSLMAEGVITASELEAVMAEIERWEAALDKAFKRNSGRPLTIDEF